MQNILPGLLIFLFAFLMLALGLRKKAGGCCSGGSHGCKTCACDDEKESKDDAPETDL